MQLPEVMLIDKPQGITSYDVIRRLQKKYGRIKMGHAGTLDPMATGLMIIGVGVGTKKLHEFLKLDKTYEAEITLGIRTDTSDIIGTVVEEKSVPQYTEEKIKEILNSMIGENELSVSVYSALKKDGKPLYTYAREGKGVEIPIRKMKVYKADFISFVQNKIKVTFDVASGTYIRSLAEEIGKRLGTVATLSGLRRIRIGDFSVLDAECID